ncbi:MAG: hypothetical protein PWQ58_123 [Archaeoglobaceae archaeon]|nr:hypothetical protein [Archaeoglobaceae archaeon]
MKLSKRLAYGKIAAIPVFILQIWLFERFDKSAFPILFFIALLTGIASVYFLRNIEDVKSRRISEPKLIAPLKNKNFLKWSLLNSAFCFSLSASRTFFAVLCDRQLDARSLLRLRKHFWRGNARKARIAWKLFLLYIVCNVNPSLNSLIPSAKIIR